MTVYCRPQDPRREDIGGEQIKALGGQERVSDARCLTSVASMVLSLEKVHSLRRWAECVYYFLIAAVTNSHTFSGLRHHKLFSSDSGDQKSVIGFTGLLLLEASRGASLL